MNDLISRQAAICALEEYADRLQMVDWKANPGVPYKAYTLNWCINTLRDLPAIQPEIIRCKGCRYYRWESDMCDYPYVTAQNVVHEDDFCSKAERGRHEGKYE